MANFTVNEDEEIETLRTDGSLPLRTERLSEDQILERYTNWDSPDYYVKEYYPDSKHQFLTPQTVVLNSDGAMEVMTRIITLLLMKNFRQLFAVMRFYRVQAFYGSPKAYRLTLREIVDHFPYGCFSELKGRVNGQSHLFGQWVIGAEKSYFLKTLVFDSTINDEDFLWLLPRMPWRLTTTMDDILDIVEEFRILSSDSEIVKRNRLNTIVDYLGDNFLVRPSARHLLLEFPYLLPIYPFANTMSSIPVWTTSIWKVTKHPRSAPRWSRAVHKFMPPDFRSRIRTILCMQRFRAQEFPVHRNVLDIIFSYVWEADLELLAKKVGTIYDRSSRLVRGYMGGGPEKIEVQNLLVEKGLVIDDPLKAVGTIIDFSLIEIGHLPLKEKAERYRLKLLDHIALKWEGTSSLVDVIDEQSTYDKLFVIPAGTKEDDKAEAKCRLIADAILQYCLDRNLSLASVRDGLVDLSDFLVELLRRST